MLFDESIILIPANFRKIFHELSENQLHVEHTVSNKTNPVAAAPGVDIASRFLRHKQIEQTHFKHPVGYCHMTVFLFQISKHKPKIYGFLLRAERYFSPAVYDVFYHVSKVFINIELLDKTFKQRRAFFQYHFYRLRNAVLGPRGRRISKRIILGKLLIDTFAYGRNKHRISRSILINFIRYRRDIHTRMLILLIFRQHGRYLFHRKAHVNIKFRGHIPWAVILMFRIRAKFQLQIFDIIYARKDYRMEDRSLISL